MGFHRRAAEPVIVTWSLVTMHCVVTLGRTLRLERSSLISPQSGESSYQALVTMLCVVTFGHLSAQPNLIIAILVEPKYSVKEMYEKCLDIVNVLKIRFE